MNDASRLKTLIETWRSAIDEFVALARDIPEDQWDLDTDLEGWSVKDNVAHTAHLEAVLAGGEEETLPVEEAPHIKNLSGFYTEQGVRARSAHDMAALVAEIEEAAAARYATLIAHPPTDGSQPPPRTPGGVPWNTQTLLSNRPLDIWMHEQDIRRAIGRPGGFDSEAARHVIATFGAGLPMIVGKRVAPPAGTSIRIDLPDAGRSWTVSIGEDGRAAFTEDAEDVTVRITLSAEDFIVLAGGRRTPDRTAASIEGDTALGEQVLAVLAMTP